MRGQQHFQTLFDLEPALTNSQVKGRDVALITSRDELLLHRYYYYGKFTDKRYDVILQHLTDEFFITERRIQDIIQDNILELRRLRQELPDLRIFKQKWPWLVW